MVYFFLTIIFATILCALSSIENFIKYLLIDFKDTSVEENEIKRISLFYGLVAILCFIVATIETYEMVENVSLEDGIQMFLTAWKSLLLLQIIMCVATYFTFHKAKATDKFCNKFNARRKKNMIFTLAILVIIFLIIFLILT